MALRIFTFIGIVIVCVLHSGLHRETTSLNLVDEGIEVML